MKETWKSYIICSQIRGAWILIHVLNAWFLCGSYENHCHFKDIVYFCFFSPEFCLVSSCLLRKLLEMGLGIRSCVWVIKTEVLLEMEAQMPRPTSSGCKFEIKIITSWNRGFIQISAKENTRFRERDRMNPSWTQAVCFCWSHIRQTSSGGMEEKCVHLFIFEVLKWHIQVNTALTLSAYSGVISSN